MTLTPKTAKPGRTILVCSCEKSMPLDLVALGKAHSSARVVRADHLCGPEVSLFRDAATRGQVTVACTAQQALFEDVAEDAQLPGVLTFANVRETAGWSSEAANAGPKMAALLAMAAAPVPPPSAAWR
jgi:heterodisulfide reductase subunit A-like polyferredoxin